MADANRRDGIFNFDDVDDVEKLMFPGKRKPAWLPHVEATTPLVFSRTAGVVASTCRNNARSGFWQAVCGTRGAVSFHWEQIEIVDVIPEDG